MSVIKANAPGRRTRSPSSEGWIVGFLKAPPEGPKYLAIAAALARAIETGEFDPGDKLPPQRTLARALSVDLTTITRAYAQVRALGLLDGEAGRGTFVRAAGTSDGPIVDLSMNTPPPPGKLALRDLVSAGVADLLRQGDPSVLMSYRTGMGSRRDRRAALAWLAPRLGDVALERIYVAPGAQTALAALIPLLARPGDVMLTEPLTYPGFIAACRLYGVRLEPMLCDENGPDPKALAAACQKLRPKAFYVTPSLQNPTAVTMSEERRSVLVELARRFDVQIIEDDAYGAFLPHMTPLARLAPERSYLVSTLSKCLSPGLRTAFVVAPPGEASARVFNALRATSLMPSPVLSDLATHWIEQGIGQQLFKAVKAESAVRLRIGRTILSDRAIGGAGFHLWLPIPKTWTLEDYLAAARERGVIVTGSDAFAVGNEAQAGVRISLGVVSDRTQMANGLKRLADLEAKRA